MHLTNDRKVRRAQKPQIMKKRKNKTEQATPENVEPPQTHSCDRVGDAVTREPLRYEPPVEHYSPPREPEPIKLMPQVSSLGCDRHYAIDLGIFTLDDCRIDTHPCHIKAPSEYVAKTVSIGKSLKYAASLYERVIVCVEAGFADGIENTEKWAENGWRRTNGERLEAAALWRGIYFLKRRFVSLTTMARGSWNTDMLYWADWLKKELDELVAEGAPPIPPEEDYTQGRIEIVSHMQPSPASAANETEAQRPEEQIPAA